MKFVTHSRIYTNTNPIYFLYDISGDLGDASVITLMFS